MDWPEIVGLAFGIWVAGALLIAVALGRLFRMARPVDKYGAWGRPSPDSADG